jgi:hypothetical protein
LHFFSKIPFSYWVQLSHKSEANSRLGRYHEIYVIVGSFALVNIFKEPKILEAEETIVELCSCNDPPAVLQNLMELYQNMIALGHVHI